MTSNYLSILLEKGGLSFLVTKDQEVIETGFTKYEPNLSMEENLNKIYNQNLYLKQAYQEKSMAYIGEKFILVPNAYLEQDKDLEKWLGFNAEVHQEDLLQQEPIEEHKVTLISAVPTALMQFAKSKLNVSHITHAGSLFLNQCSVTEDKDQMFLNVHRQQIEVIAFRNQKLFLYNIFDYSTKEDILYHLLNTMKQLAIDANTVELYYYGLTEADATLKMTMNFIRHVIPATSQLQTMKHFSLIKNLQVKI